MDGKTDQMKGRGKEAVGALSGDKDLQFEGKVDRRAGEAKEKVDHALNRIEKAIDEVKGLLHRR